LYDRQVLSEHLLSYIDTFEMADSTLTKSSFLAHKVQKLGTVGAFDGVTVRVLSSHALPIRIDGTWYNYLWQAALYLVSKEAPPIWYQLDIPVSQELLNLANDQMELALGDRQITLTRLSGSRPIVAWSNIQRNGS
jgi:hypothetical protein